MQVGSENLPIEVCSVKTEYNFIEKVIKRFVDILGAICGIILLVPVTIVVFFINIFKGEKSKIFFKQKRIGRNGKLFEIYKFQTMIPNADEYLKEYLSKNEEAKIEYKKYKKLKNDPRVTPVGNFLRKTSLDEFPQFINVLIGNMTLVGPRPYLPREIDDMGEYYNYIIKCTPGITGPWQISGRSNTNFEDRLKIDKEYYENLSLKNDALILFKTVKNILNKTGAL